MRLLLESEPSDPDELHLNRLDSLATLRRLEAIADGLLTVSRQEGNDASVAGELVDIDEVVLDVVDRLPHRAEVSFDCSAVQAGQVRGSEADLDRMVDNLLSNAARHAATSVRLGVCEQEGTVVFTVSDDGAGIPINSRGEIYERFTRLDEARARDSGGVGLGLSIVHAVVSAHRGTIAVEESQAGGAEFTVRIPSSTSMARHETNEERRARHQKSGDDSRRSTSAPAALAPPSGWPPDHIGPVQQIPDRATDSATDHLPAEDFDDGVRT